MPSSLDLYLVSRISFIDCLPFAIIPLFFSNFHLSSPRMRMAAAPVYNFEVISLKLDA